MTYPPLVVFVRRNDNWIVEHYVDGEVTYQSRAPVSEQFCMLLESKVIACGGKTIWRENEAQTH